MKTRVHGCLVFVALLSLLGCKGPRAVLKVPHDVGYSEHIRAPASDVARHMTAALRRAEFKNERIVERGPERWIAVGRTPMTFGSDGLWGKVVVVRVTPNLTRVTSYVARRGGGQFDSPFSTARNILVNMILLTSPAAEGSENLRRQAFQPAGG